MNVINETTAGGRLGSAVGSGFGAVLENLAAQKLENMSAQQQFARQQQQAALQRQQQSQALSSLGISEPMAQSIASLNDPVLQRNILSNLGSLGFGQQQNHTQTPQINFQAPNLRFKEQEIALKQQDLGRKQRESQAKIDLSLARSKRLEEQSKLDAQKQQVNEKLGQAQLQLSKAKNDIDKQRLQNQIEQLNLKKLSLDDKFQKSEDSRLLKEEKQNLAKQKAIDTKLKPYRTNLDKRYVVSESILSKANEMLQLLESGEVNTGISGKYQPLWLSNDATNRFSGLADDVANELASLSTGTQTISKIRFNQQRKPNTAQSTQTQIDRTNDLIKEAGKVVLENDIVNYFVNENGGENPTDLQQKTHQLIKKIGEPPLKSLDNQEGQILDDPKRGVSWIVSGPVLRFNGLI
jgi:hypothetical protein